MNNLENKKILSDKMLKVVKQLSSEFPNIVFGGSIGLNAVGLIERNIGDIDVFVDENHKILSSKYFNFDEVKESQKENLDDSKYKSKIDKLFDLDSLESFCTKQKQTDVESPDADDSQTFRSSIVINNVKVCVFKTSNEELLKSFKFKLEDFEINLQHIQHAIKMKVKYVKKLKGENRLKHINDLSVFNLDIEDKLPF